MTAKNSSKLSRVRGRAKKIKHSRGKAKSTEVVYHSTKEIKVERALIENFIGLQKVMVGLSAKFDNLSAQISKLLELFELSAKSLARKEASSASGLEARQVMEKLDRLSAQAGLIGKGLALIHEVGTETGRPSIPILQGKQPGRAVAQSTTTFSSPLIKNPAENAPAPKMTREVFPENPLPKKIKPSTPGENASL